MIRTQEAPAAAVDRVVGTQEAAALVNFSVAHFRTLYRNGKVPKPIWLSERKLGWRLSDLQNWVAEKCKESVT